MTSVILMAIQANPFDLFAKCQLGEFSNLKYMFYCDELICTYETGLGHGTGQ